MDSSELRRHRRERCTSRTVIIRSVTTVGRARPSAHTEGVHNVAPFFFSFFPTKKKESFFADTNNVRACRGGVIGINYRAGSPWSPNGALLLLLLPLTSTPFTRHLWPEHLVTLMEKIGEPVLFRTKVPGYYGFFQFGTNEVKAIAPPTANAYFFVTDPQNEPGATHQFSMVQFYRIKADDNKRLMRADKLAHNFDLMMQLLAKEN